MIRCRAHRFPGYVRPIVVDVVAVLEREYVTDGSARMFVTKSAICSKL
jgi:hypothetical protein